MTGTEMFNGICGKVAPGLCKLSMDGTIAVKTSSGYRTYDPATERLTNCDSLVLDIGEDFFFVLPANKVSPGDIILVGGKPRCVVKAEKNLITVINYEDMTVEHLLPEHHVFMGNTYLYGRIVSLFGKKGTTGKGGVGRMMKYMMLSSVMKGKGSEQNNLLPFLLMGGGKDDLFGDLLEEEDDTGDTE